MLTAGKDLLGLGGLMPTIGTDLALSLLYVSEALVHPVLDCVVFPDDLD